MTTRPENEAALPTAASRANACTNPLVQRLFAQDARRFACRAQTPLEFGQWQVAARDAYAKLLALPVIAAAADGHRARIRLETAADDLGEMTRRRGAIETDPEVWIEFWMLTPKGHGPFPLALTPHGHGSGDLYAGVCRDEDERRRMEREDRDVAVQAARNGFLAIAPAREPGREPGHARLWRAAARSVAPVLRHLARLPVRRAEPPFSGRNNLKTFAMLSAAIESVETGKPVEIIDHPKYRSAYERKRA